MFPIQVFSSDYHISVFFFPSRSYLANKTKKSCFCSGRSLAPSGRPVIHVGDAAIGRSKKRWWSPPPPLAWIQDSHSLLCFLHALPRCHVLQPGMACREKLRGPHTSEDVFRCVGHVSRDWQRTRKKRAHRDRRLLLYLEEGQPSKQHLKSACSMRRSRGKSQHTPSSAYRIDRALDNFSCCCLRMMLYIQHARRCTHGWESCQVDP